MDTSFLGPIGRRLRLGASQVVLLGFLCTAGDAFAASVAPGPGPTAAPASTAAPPVSPEASDRDPLSMDALLDQNRVDIDLTAVDAADWAPDHAPKIAESTSASSPVPGLQAQTPQAQTPQAQPPNVPAPAQTAKLQEPAGKAAEKQQSAEKSQAARSGADNDADPEPDKAVVPPSATDSNDPLDRPRPAAGSVPPPRDAARPVPAAKVEPGKPAATEPGKTDAAGAAKPDAAAPSATTPQQQAAEPLPPLNATIKAALDKRAATTIKGPGAAEKRKEREAVSFFYAAHGFAPAWSEKGKAVAAVEPVLARLAKAGDDALTIPNVPAALAADGSPDEVAASDLALTEAVVAYARQATGSRVEPHTIGPLIGAKRALADPAEILDGLVAAGPQAGDKLAALNPTEPRYVALREKLAEIRGERGQASKPTDDQIPDGPTLRVGMRDSRVPLLRTRFNVEATSDADDAERVYDKAVAAAVTAFQREHDLVPSGMLGARTLAALNGGKSAAPHQSSAKLEGTIVANMEMWRWMPREMGRERIEVNVPDYLVTVFHDNEAVAKNRVVVGKTETPTPIFSNTMKYLIVNPVWNVPQSIIKNEFGGAAHGFKARYVNGKLYLQQPSGPKNALGRIKFMFPNDFSVYLHDTPAKHLFANAKRAYSHGCVRVDKPFEFAESVLNDAVAEGGKIQWNQKRLEKMLGNTERYVNLPAPLPIHIEYFTASIDGDGGKVHLRDDIYGYAGAVAAALGYGKAPTVVAGDKSLVAAAAESKARKRRVASRRQAYDDDPYDPRPQVQAAPAQSSRGFFFPW